MTRKTDPLADVLTIAEAAVVMRLSESTVLKYCQAGRLKSRLGRESVWLVSRQADEAWVSDPPGPKPKANMRAALQDNGKRPRKKR